MNRFGLFRQIWREVLTFWQVMMPTLIRLVVFVSNLMPMTMMIAPSIKKTLHFTVRQDDHHHNTYHLIILTTTHNKK